MTTVEPEPDTLKEFRILAAQDPEYLLSRVLLIILDRLDKIEARLERAVYHYDPSRDRPTERLLDAD